MVEWRALVSILKEMCFPLKFIRWITECVTTMSYQFNINGEYSSRMIARRGRRQGDFLFPLLFVIVMNYL